MRPTLTLFPLLIWRCFCRAIRDGHPTGRRSRLSTLKGWPPSQLEDGTLCDFSVSRSVGLPVSGLKSVQSFGLAQIFHAMVDLDLTASPIRISLSTASFNYGRNSQRLVGNVVFTKEQIILSDWRARTSGREKLEVCAPFATGKLTRKTFLNPEPMP